MLVCTWDKLLFSEILNSFCGNVRETFENRAKTVFMMSSRKFDYSYLIVTPAVIVL